MKPILIAYATTEGQTRKIAEFIGRRLRRKGCEVHVVDTATPAAEQVSPIYAGAILGGSLHQHRHQSSLEHFAKANAAWLNVIPLAFFSVSLSMAGDDAAARAEAKRLAEEFLDVAGLHAGTVELIAGALKYTRYDFFKRWVMRLIAARAGGDTDISCDHEYTDWHGVRRFADECAAAMQSVHGEPVDPDPGADAFPGGQRDEGARVGFLCRCGAHVTAAPRGGAV